MAAPSGCNALKARATGRAAGWQQQQQQGVGSGGRLVARLQARPVGGRERRQQQPGGHRHGTALAASERLTGPTKPAGAPAPPAAEEAAPAEADALTEEEALKLESWGQAVEAQTNGADVTVLLTRYTKSGFVAKAFGIPGFLPYSLMDASKLPPKGAPDASDKLRSLLGSHATVKVVEVDIGEQRLIFSQVAAMTRTLLAGIEVGQEYDAVVRTVTDFGAFVDFEAQKGQVAQGLVHKSELGWEAVTVTSSVVQPGMPVRVKVLGVDKEKGHIALSMKQCQDDPLLANLDTMLPVEEDPNVVWEETTELLPGLDEILTELRADDGVLFVTPGRQAERPGIVSQDLQIFMTKEQVADGYNLVARAGARVQELRVATDLSRTEMVRVLTTALKKIAK